MDSPPRDPPEADTAPGTGAVPVADAPPPSAAVAAVMADLDAENSSSDDETGQAPATRVPEGHPKNKKKPAYVRPSVTDMLGSRLHWRALGLFALEGALDRPYMIMECVLRAKSVAPLALLARVSASDGLAQLVLSPLYSHKIRLEADPERPAFFRIAELEGPPRFELTGRPGINVRNMTPSRSAFEAGERHALNFDPLLYLEPLAPYRAHPYCASILLPPQGRENLVAFNTKNALHRALATPLTSTILEDIFEYSLVACAGVTRKWKWSPYSVPVEMHVVRRLHEDPLGMWVNHAQMWEGVADEARKTRIGEWPAGRHCARFEGAQLETMWLIARKRYNVRARAQRFYRDLLLRTVQRPSNNGQMLTVDYTADKFLSDHAQRGYRAHGHPARVSHLVMALERARFTGMGRTVLHVRPMVNHLVLTSARIVSQTVGTPCIPLASIETVTDYVLLRHLLNCDEARGVFEHEPDRVFKLALCTPRDWYETHGGLLRCIDLPSTLSEAQLWALALARQMIDHRSDLSMEHSRSSAYRVPLDRIMTDVCAWLYGRQERGAGASHWISRAQLVDYLSNVAKPRLYLALPGGDLVRITDVDTARREGMIMTGMGTLMRESHVDVALYPQAPLVAGGAAALQHLCEIITQYPLATVLVVTPYQATRRALALARALQKTRGMTAPQAESETTGLVCDVTSKDLTSRERLQRATTLVVEAAHLLNSAAFIDVINTVRSNLGTTRRLVIVGSTHLLANSNGPGMARGCVFRDLVQTHAQRIVHETVAGRILAAPVAQEAYLALAVTYWTTHTGEPIVQFCDVKPSTLHLQDHTYGCYFALAADTQRYMPYAANPDATKRSANIHRHYAPGVDLHAVYQMPWSTFWQVSLHEFLTALSHGYRIVVYARESESAPMPTTALEPTDDTTRIAAVLRDYYVKNKKISSQCHTAWQLLWLDDYMKKYTPGV